MAMAEIMVDVDDVLMPWSEPVRDVGVDLGLVEPGAPWASWSPWLDWGIHKRQWYEILTHANIGGLYIKTTPYVDAVNQINRLKWEGHNIHIVTARQGKNIERVTRNWFHDNGIAYTTMTFTQDKVAAQETLGVEFDYAVDDGPHNFDALMLAGVQTYLMDQPHNQHLETTMRVRSLTEFGLRIRLEEIARGRATA